MADSLDRRPFLKSAAAAGAAVGLNTAVNPALLAAEEGETVVQDLARRVVVPPHAQRQEDDDNLDFPVVAKNDFGIDAVEYVNQFFKDKAKDDDVPRRT